MPFLLRAPLTGRSAASTGEDLGWASHDREGVGSRRDVGNQHHPGPGARRVGRPGSAGRPVSAGSATGEAEAAAPALCRGGGGDPAAQPTYTALCQRAPGLAGALQV